MIRSPFCRFAFLHTFYERPCTILLIFEDWLFHALLPFAAYAALVVSAYAARSNLEQALFGVGAAALLLLFIGIHNAWDGVTYHVLVVNRGKPKKERQR